MQQRTLFSKPYQENLNDFVNDCEKNSNESDMHKISLVNIAEKQKIAKEQP